MNDPEFKDAVRTVWDLASPAYDLVPGHQIGSREEWNAWERELSGDLPSAPGKVLDIGCGTGAMALVLARMGYQVTGIDLSGEMIAMARNKAVEDGIAIGLISGDAEKLPFDDGSFDIIVTRHLLWTVPHPEIALREWYRVLAPNGRVLIIDGVWNDGSPGTRIRIGISSRMARLFDPKSTHPASYNNDIRIRLPHHGGVPGEAMLDYLNQAGFVDIKEKDLMYIRSLQQSQLSWYRRLAQGESYYLIAAIKPEMCIY
ncbi:MAG TPA: methyltransferase domain-containing protein [Methanoregulaceae archaeon]|nr:methyltransferase domain-containing protein [Methanoregulaceae archaeon]